MKKSVPIVTLLSALFVIAACGSKSGSNYIALAGKTIKTIPVGNLTATLANDAGMLKHGNQELTLTFTDGSAKPVDVGTVLLNFHMPQMGSMAAMNDAVTFTTTNIPGVYRGKVDLEVGGEWQGQLAYEGPAGNGKTTFSVTAQ